MVKTCVTELSLRNTYNEAGSCICTWRNRHLTRISLKSGGKIPKQQPTTKQKIILFAICQISIFLGLLLKFVGALWCYFKEGAKRMGWNQLILCMRVLWKVMPIFFFSNQFKSSSTNKSLPGEKIATLTSWCLNLFPEAWAHNLTAFLREIHKMTLYPLSLYLAPAGRGVEPENNHRKRNIHAR